MSEFSSKQKITLSDHFSNTEDNVFANFERVSSFTGVSREQALMTYLLKHIDGINSFTNGYESQREDITGRITDAIVYLCLLWGMISDKRAKQLNETSQSEVLAYENIRGDNNG